MFDSMPNLPSALQPRDAFTEFKGGLDIETPAWSTMAGALRDALNYEIGVEDGYQDITGYERFDGRPAPSDASFTILDFTETGSIEVGDTVTGAISGATGLVIAIAAYPDDPTQDYLVLTKVTGTFDEDAENLEVSAVVEGNTDADGYADSAPTSKLKAQYKNLAADAYRSDIQAVPGEGDVWGGFTLEGTKYALRNKVGSVTAGLYKATAGGWSEIDLGRELAFTSGGVTEIAEGNVITGATSAATATVERVILTSGTWAGGDAAGYFYLSGQTGTFQAENLNVGASLNLATIAGNSTALTLQPDGRLDYDISNFADTQGPERAYCADGVNRGWELDSSGVYVPIRTGMTDDTPDHVYVHKNHLFFSFDGSIQHSGPAEPYSWSVILGAAEIATGFDITGFQVEPGAADSGALLVCCRQRLFMLYGNDVSDWSLIRYREKVGAYEWTIQQIAYTLFLDDRGITDYRTAQEFGNFDHSALSEKIRRLINQKRSLAVASCVVRDKNQYRLFFSDNTAIYVTMDGPRLKGMMPISLGDDVKCAWSEEDEDGAEEVFFGSDDGFVYQMERGTSFDGDEIYAYLYTHFDHGGAIEWEKDYEGPITIEGKSAGYAEIDVGYELDYARSEVFQPETQTAELPISQGAMFDTGIEWDTGVVWDQSSLIPSLALDLRGEGRNISWIVSKNSDYFNPVLLSGIHYRYIGRSQRKA